MIDVSRLTISFIMFSKKRLQSSSSSSLSSSMYRPTPITVNTPLYQYKQYDTTIDHVSNKIPSLINTIQYVPKKRFKVRSNPNCYSAMRSLPLLLLLPVLLQQQLLQQLLLLLLLLTTTTSITSTTTSTTTTTTTTAYYYYYVFYYYTTTTITTSTTSFITTITSTITI